MRNRLKSLGISAVLFALGIGACSTEREYGAGTAGAGTGGQASATAGVAGRAGATVSAGAAGEGGVPSVSACDEGATRACKQDTAHSYLGNCADGKETCEDGAWSDCDVQPAAADACEAGDDADCDGSPNEGCPCVDGTSQACGPAEDVGVCKRGTQLCSNQTWGACEGAVFASARDCTSSSDNDCDGVSDSSVDDVCRCTEGSKRACDSHPGDGKGPCKAGEQSCVVAADKTSSDYTACSGAVGPAEKDTCEPQNDADCDGLANEGCACVNGATQPCSENKGVCKLGKQTCQSQKWGACDGVLPGTRDCTSALDNDCNGTSDKQDSTCACSASRACNTHPGQDGKGPCKAGSEACVVAADKQSSTWSGTCSGYVDPAAKDTCNAGNDADCSGTVGDSCACINAAACAQPGTTCKSEQCGVWDVSFTCSNNTKVTASWNFTSSLDGWSIDEVNSNVALNLLNLHQASVTGPQGTPVTVMALDVGALPSTPAPQDIVIRVQLCPGITFSTLTNYKLVFDMRRVTSSGTAGNNNEIFATSLITMQPQNKNIPSGWNNLELVGLDQPTEHSNSLYIGIHTWTLPWSGSIYFDNMRLVPQ